MPDKVKDMREYVDIKAVFFKEGAVMPEKIRLKDGKVLKIDRLVHTCRSCPADDFEGIRYTVITGGVQKYIYEHNGRWYIDPAEKEEKKT